VPVRDQEQQRGNLRRLRVERKREKDRGQREREGGV
jgi:hypothetical protein